MTASLLLNSTPSVRPYPHLLTLGPRFKPPIPSCVPQRHGLEGVHRP